MLNRLSEKFHEWANGRLVIALLLVYGFFAGYVMPLMAANMNAAAKQSVTPLDLMFFYSPQQAFEMMDRYGDAGRTSYLTIELTADIVYPIASALFFSLLLKQRIWSPKRRFRICHFELGLRELVLGGVLAYRVGQPYGPFLRGQVDFDLVQASLCN